MKLRELFMRTDLDKCYMCDDEVVSKEHVPPRCLFPKSKDLQSGADLRKDLVTVPSCHLHNSEKSGEDVYFLNVLTSCEQINEVGREHFRNQIRRQNERNPSIISRFLERSVDVDDKLGHEIEIERLDGFVTHLAAALYMAFYDTKWNGSELGWMPEFLARSTVSEDTKRLAMVKENDKKFDSVECHGSNQEVFKFQVIEGGKKVKMRLHFYQGCKLYLEFTE
jgi:hypothetical protein